MTQRLAKLVTLLKELFQLDQPDLDFGFYRIMHAKSAEVTQFLETDLLPQVRAAFAQYQPADKAAVEKELADLKAGIEKAGMDPSQSPKVKELERRLKEDSVDLDALEAEVYDHLYGFFRRYYSEGDFLSKRVYKPGVYAIPYEGEEVKLHWANADQYYIKTSEYLRDYAFRLRPDDKSNPMRVHFRLVDAAEGEHGNVKEATGKERRFRLAPDNAVAVENGELVVRFTYQPDSAKQKDLNAAAEQAIFKARDASLPEWLHELGRKHVRTDGTESDATRLRVHLDRYTARNTFDYFIHKDLGGFLRRELDFYIKNEVMHLDDVEHEAAPRVEQYLSKLKVIRRIAGKIIDFLAQLEDFQKKLWLKKKFVVETSWCIRVGCIPEEFYPEIAANEAQREEWVMLCAIDEIQSNLTAPGYSVPLKPDFLKAMPTLVVDTRHFEHGFANRLLASFAGLGDSTDVVLFHGENFQALSMMQRSYAGAIKCVYIDPPYNSKTSEIAYKNSYRDSSWLSLIDGRLDLSRRLSTDDGSHIVAIDENEQELLGQLLGLQFPSHDKICVAVIHNKKGIQGEYFSHNHEYAYFCIAPGLSHTRGAILPEAQWEYTNLRKWGRESERATARNCFYPIFVKDGAIVGFGEVCPDGFHPGASNVAERGRIEVYPVDGAGVERKWRYARGSVEAIRRLLRVHVTPSGEVQIQKAVEEKPIKTVWDDPRYIAGDYGTKWLTDLALKVRDDLYPKSVHVVEDSVRAVSDEDSWILDYFAGSGTTAHAVINLNREDGGKRKVVLVEMGDYFDTVLLPRLKRVTFSPEWKDGKPKRHATPQEAERSPRIIKVVRLESYEDALNNLDLRARTDEQQTVLGLSPAQGPDKLREQYLLRYMLEVETRGSQSLLNIDTFTDPTAYRLKVKVRGSDEARELNVNLLETFNWLIGLTVQRIAAAQTFKAMFERDSEKRLRLKGHLGQAANGPWWFRTVTGALPDGRKTLVIWRKRPGGESPEGIEEDNLVLDEWFTQQDYSSKGNMLDLIYVNGSNNLENLKPPDSTWKVRLIEESIFELMFETEGA